MISRVLIAILIASIPSISNALNCSVLEPKKAENTDLDTKGKVDSNIKGLLSKLASVDVDVDGAYKLIKNDTLKEYPNADQLYIWERLLFSYCEIINESKISDTEKLNRFESLIEKMTFGPKQKNETQCVSSIQRSDLLKRQHELNEEITQNESKLQKLNKEYSFNEKVISQNKIRMKNSNEQIERQIASLNAQVKQLGPRGQMNEHQVRTYRNLMGQIGMTIENRRKMNEQFDKTRNDHEIMGLEISKLERRLKSDKINLELVSSSVAQPSCKS